MGDSMLRQLVLCALSSVFLLVPLTSKAVEYGDSQFSPSVGQAGKDVIWVPTPDQMVTAMLNAANVTSKDLVYDLGAGDGKIAIAAARQFGATAVGIEYDEKMAALATRNVARAAVQNKVTIIRGDIFKEDFSKASVVTLYLLPDLNHRLRPTILKMKPGTRVVSHSFDMAEWEPDQRIETESASGYMWIVPASVAGNWTLDVAGFSQPIELQLSQSFQIVNGSMMLDGKKLMIDTGRMRGDQLRFSVKRPSGQVLTFEGRVSGGKLTGRMQPMSDPLNVSGKLVKAVR
jgi:SAM-dependent methyltransferase